MTTRMLIDARHREETRVAVVQGNRIEEFDFESAERKQLKGNIYLAKVTRVEPSLQAAFVDYGGNRHGFLAFSEIHPDYYQIPKEDRDALLAEEAEHAAEEAALRAAEDGDDADHGDDEDDGFAPDPADDDAEGEDDAAEEAAPRPGQDDQVEALRARRQSLRRRYKIQDVIRRRQVLLVQVVKEERGNKGAALTTYLSLAGRYCVLMPNTSHGGGISRKISNGADRKRLKSIMAELALPASMGCIVRTAGLQRTKTEIKRDFDYLARLWDGIRENTLTSAAPALIYGDSDLIKRAIRDIFNSEVDEIVVEGEEGYRHAREFMKLLMPGHAGKVKHYSDAVPLFQRAHVEDQLAAMYHPVVQLKSGGYLVINPTEALVSIDINSGRSTREHNIEQTATATNLEAAAEIARQLRLRDMAGLVVIDFIDMDHNSNVRKVERAMKEALKDDRARIQVGRISSFGLMEMSRQRLRTGVLEASTRACPHCEGTGLVRTASSAGLSALRLIEDEAARGRGSLLTLRASQEAAFYVLNRKRDDIAEIEERYGVRVEVLPGGEVEGARMSVEAGGPPPAHAPRFDAAIEEADEPVEADDYIEEEVVEQVEVDAEDGEGDRGGRRRRRRRGRRGRARDEEAFEALPAPEAEATDDEGEDAPADAVDDVEAEAEAETADASEASDDAGGRRRRRRRGRGRGRGRDEAASGTEADGEPEEADAPVEPEVAPEPAPEPEPATEEAADAGDSGPVTTPLAIAEVEDEAPKPRRRPRARKADAAAEAPAQPEFVGEAPAPKPRRTRRKAVAETGAAEVEGAEAGAVAAEPAAPAEEAPKPRRRPRARKAEADAAPAPAAVEAEPEAVATEPEAQPEAETAEADTGDAPAPRRGWWQRTFGN